MIRAMIVRRRQKKIRERRRIEEKRRETKSEILHHRTRHTLNGTLQLQEKRCSWQELRATT